MVQKYCKYCWLHSRQGTDRLIAQKDYCMDTLSRLVPLADATLEITSLVVPQANWARTGKNIVSLMSDLLRSSHSIRSGRSPERYFSLSSWNSKFYHKRARKFIFFLFFLFIGQYQKITSTFQSEVFIFLMKVWWRSEILITKIEKVFKNIWTTW